MRNQLCVHRSSSLLFMLSLLVTIGFAEAKGPRLPAPDPERGAIAVTVRGRFPLGQKSPAIQVYFVRLAEDADMYSAESVIASDFSKGKQVYLLNAKPGRYVAVAARLRNQAAFVAAGDYVVFFDRALIPQTAIEVTAGRIAFMGDLAVDLKVKMSEADEAQMHYLRLVEPEAARMGFMGRALSHEYMYRGELIELDREAATEKAFWTLARAKIFAGAPDWRGKVEQQLEQQLAANLDR